MSCRMSRERTSRSLATAPMRSSSVSIVSSFRIVESKRTVEHPDLVVDEHGATEETLLGERLVSVLGVTEEVERLFDRQDDELRRPFRLAHRNEPSAAMTAAR